MLFSGIEIPNQVNVLNRDLIILEELSKKFNETPETYITASLGLVATWGEMIRLSNFSPDFVHGIANDSENTIELFDIPQYCKDNVSRFAEREKTAIEMGLYFSDDKTEFKVDLDDIVDLARIACGYFDQPFESMMSTAIDLRENIISSQNVGNTYVFSYDKVYWTDVELITYPE